GLLRSLASGSRGRTVTPTSDPGGVTRDRLAASGLPLLPRPGNGALGRCGHRRLQLLLRRQRPAPWIDADQPVAHLRAGGRSAQFAGTWPKHVQRQSGFPQFQGLAFLFSRSSEEVPAAYSALLARAAR